MEAVGLLVHGNRAVSDASGGDCREVATGSRLYVGGMQASARGGRGRRAGRPFLLWLRPGRSETRNQKKKDPPSLIHR